MLVSISVIAVIPRGDRGGGERRGQGPARGGRSGLPGVPIDKIFPFLTVFAVANTALINMLMASRLLYGLAKQDVPPPPRQQGAAGRRTRGPASPSTLLALGLIVVVTYAAETTVIAALSGTTALLLLCVFSIVNIACLVLRRDPTPSDGSVPDLGAHRRRGLRACSWWAVGPRPGGLIQYEIAGACSRSASCSGCSPGSPTGVRAKKTGFRDIDTSRTDRRHHVR